MHRKIYFQEAERLVEEIRDPLLLPLPERTKINITKYLTGVEHPESVIRFGKNSFSILEDSSPDKIQHLSLRRLINNWRVGPVRKSIKERGIDYIVGALGFFSSDIIVRDLLSDEEMYGLIRSCRDDVYSLVGKIETIDLSTGKEERSIIPLLVIPGHYKQASGWISQYYPNELVKKIGEMGLVPTR